MANRSYLYTRHMGDDAEFRDFAEWKWDLPPAHLILVGANPVLCKSVIWTVDEKIAIEGDANLTRPLFLKFLDWLEPQVEASARDAIQESRQFLNRTDRQGDKFHLEIGELYECASLELEAMESVTEQNASLAEALFLDVKRVLDTEGSTIKSFEHKRLLAINNWEEEFGLYFSHILYFHLGG